jgi:hypothetical protein
LGSQAAPMHLCLMKYLGAHRRPRVLSYAGLRDRAVSIVARWRVRLGQGRHGCGGASCTRASDASSRDAHAHRRRTRPCSTLPHTDVGRVLTRRSHTPTSDACSPDAHTHRRRTRPRAPLTPTDVGRVLARRSRTPTSDATSVDAPSPHGRTSPMLTWNYYASDACALRSKT